MRLILWQSPDMIMDRLEHATKDNEMGAAEEVIVPNHLTKAMVEVTLSTHGLPAKERIIVDATLCAQEEARCTALRKQAKTMGRFDFIGGSYSGGEWLPDGAEDVKVAASEGADEDEDDTLPEPGPTDIASRLTAHATATGRLSSRDSNIANFPRRVLPQK